MSTDGYGWYNMLGHYLCYCKEEATYRAADFAILLSSDSSTNTGLVIPIEYKCSAYDYQVEAYCLWRFDQLFYSQSWSDSEREYAWGNYAYKCKENIRNDSDLQQALKWLVDVEFMNPNFSYSNYDYRMTHSG